MFAHASFLAGMCLGWLKINGTFQCIGPLSSCPATGSPTSPIHPGQQTHEALPSQGHHAPPRPTRSQEGSIYRGRGERRRATRGGRIGNRRQYQQSFQQHDDPSCGPPRGASPTSARQTTPDNASMCTEGMLYFSLYCLLLVFIFGSPPTCCSSTKAFSYIETPFTISRKFAWAYPSLPA